LDFPPDITYFPYFPIFHICMYFLQKKSLFQNVDHSFHLFKSHINIDKSLFYFNSSYSSLCCIQSISMYIVSQFILIWRKYTQCRGAILMMTFRFHKLFSLTTRSWRKQAVGIFYGKVGRRKNAWTENWIVGWHTWVVSIKRHKEVMVQKEQGHSRVNQM
jgi:hypothetical protein